MSGTRRMAAVRIGMPVNTGLPGGWRPARWRRRRWRSIRTGSEIVVVPRYFRDVVFAEVSISEVLCAPSSK